MILASKDVHQKDANNVHSIFDNFAIWTLWRTIHFQFSENTVLARITRTGRLELYSLSKSFDQAIGTKPFEYSALK